MKLSVLANRGDGQAGMVPEAVTGTGPVLGCRLVAQ